VLIEGLPDERLDYGLTAHVQVLRGLIQFLQHAGSDIHIHALNRLDHAALALEEMRNVLALIGQSRNRLGGNGRCAAVGSPRESKGACVRPAPFQLTGPGL
jgi:hypothetical protein